MGGSRKTLACPTEKELSRAATLGAEGGVRDHVEDCARCSRVVGSLLRAGALLREVPVRGLDPDDKIRLRQQVLARASASAQDPRRWWRSRLGFGLLFGLLPVSLAAAMVLLRPTNAPPAGPVVARAVPASPPPSEPAPPEPITRGTVHALAAARFARVNTQPDEIIRLEEGSVTTEVQPLREGERFRVVTGDGEVEVRGTVFDVTAHSDRLTAVRVLHGRVEVRVNGRMVATLNAGERWTAPPEESARARPAGVVAPPARARSREHLVPPEATAPDERETQPPHAGPAAPAARDAPGTPEAKPRPPPSAARPAPVPKPAPSQPDERPPGSAPDPGERELEIAWQALKSENPLRAAAAFDRAARAAGSSPLAEDAWFWRAVALQRGGRPEQARAALTAFVSKFPASPRKGEASAMLGWLLYDAGDLAGARLRFRAALGDDASSVRDSAAAGLRALDSAPR